MCVLGLDYFIIENKYIFVEINKNEFYGESSIFKQAS